MRSLFVPYLTSHISSVHLLIDGDSIQVRADSVPCLEVCQIPSRYRLQIEGREFVDISPSALPRIMLQGFSTDKRREAFLSWVEALPSLINQSGQVSSEIENIVLKFVCACEEAKEAGKDDRTSLDAGFVAGLSEWQRNRPIERVGALSRSELTQIFTGGLLPLPAAVQSTLANHQAVVLAYMSGVYKWVAFYGLAALAHTPLYHDPGEGVSFEDGKNTELMELFSWLLDQRTLKQVQDSDYPEVVKAIMLAVFRALEPKNLKTRSSFFPDALALSVRSQKRAIVPSAIVIARNAALQKGDEFTMKLFRRELAKRWHPDANNGCAIPESLQPFVTGDGFKEWEDSTPAHKLLSVYCTGENVPEFNRKRAEQRGIAIDLAVHLFGSWIEDALTPQHQKWLNSYRQKARRRRKRENGYDKNARQ